MGSYRILFPVTIVTLLTSFSISTVTKANVFDDVWGIVTDPFKLGAATKNIMRSLVQLREMESTVNAHVDQRLEQLRLIVNGSLDKVEYIEDKINQDSKQLLLRVTCATGDVLNNQLQTAISAALNKIGDASPGIKIGPFTFFQIKTTKINITKPDIMYYDTKKLILSDLNSTITEKSDPQIIFSAYVNLEQLAKATRCAYIDTIAERDFQNEAADLEILAIPWRTTFTTRHP